MAYSSPDKFIYPVYIGSDNMLEWTSDSTAFSFRIPSGYYWVTRRTQIALSTDLIIGADVDYGVFTSDSTGQGRKPLINAVVDGINEIIDSQGGSFALAEETATPSVAGPPDSGLRLYQSGGATEQWTLLVDPEEGQANPVLAQALGGSPDVGIEFSNFDETSDYSCLGWWHTVVAAHDRRPRKQRLQFGDETSHGVAYTNAWTKEDARSFHYFDIDGENIRPRATTFMSPDVEHSNNAVVNFLNRASESNRVTYGVYNNPASLPSLDPDDYSNVESLKPLQGSTFSSLRDAITDLNGGDRYEVRFEMEVTDD